MDEQIDQDPVGVEIGRAQSRDLHENKGSQLVPVLKAVTT